ncbi:DUF1697 domain-containing protein [Allosaccharopolyspora coralli]|uniref:DUF1697 domain-containing protein n=1 Tax=Allosaccharopolyspora coralli TaxID=2665642 RepID=UPI001651B5AE|nr:DUF1697 domain-containing protein [Allosaccharopolyspora coralli]
MSCCVALLRGINLGPANKVDMAELRTVFTALGHQEVSTYIRSGNVVFRSDRADLDEIARESQARIERDLGVTSAVIVRSHSDLEAVLRANPFMYDEHDPAKLHVAFLGKEPAPDVVDALNVPSGESARFAVVGREMYLHYPNGSARTKLGTSFLARLGVVATARNWRTVHKLHALTAD